MNELSTADKLQVQLPERDEMSLQAYLPESFGPKDLGIESGLMSLWTMALALKRVMIGKRCAKRTEQEPCALH